MKVEGSAYGNKVLEGVNEVREINGCAPLKYGGSGSLLERCKEMALGGVLLAPQAPMNPRPDRRTAVKRWV